MLNSISLAIPGRNAHMLECRRVDMGLPSLTTFTEAGRGDTVPEILGSKPQPR